MTFPICGRKKSIRHRSGSKDYHLVLLHPKKGGKSLIVNRWGKAGSWGQMQVEKFDTHHQATSAFNRKLREKEGRGYEEDLKDDQFEATDETHLRATLGPQYWNKLGVENIKHLLPTASTDGVRDPESVEGWEKRADGSFKPIEKPPRLVEPEPPTVEEKVAKNPLWGSF